MRLRETGVAVAWLVAVLGLGEVSEASKCMACRPAALEERGILHKGIESIRCDGSAHCSEACAYLEVLFERGGLAIDSTMTTVDGFHYNDHKPDIKFKKSYVLSPHHQKTGYVYLGKLMAHESMHHLHPEWSEDRVYDEAEICRGPIIERPDTLVWPTFEGFE